MVSLAAFEEEALRAWIDEMQAEHAQSRIDAGEDPVLAHSTAQAEADALFPGGRPAEGQLVFQILEDGGPAGSLWIGPAAGSTPSHWWVWNIKIDERRRGRGLGRAAMLLAEEEARARHATQLGLNVFNHNEPAVHLYETLGYRVTSQQMRKTL
jgi:ribosomal protein S18 acetylase RimI-like enzyme